ncbi:ethylene-responsive transcription factor ERF020-like [Lolium perenne]|uniref:ethylene-responsive transcription factor ERF020-like n=1 Tax=Lolium perenne TaxID=4522 RepID=UPI0021EA2253|nr:ethylene-responsive transcription factor ERF020-like [Lolium perenne]
MSRAEAEEERCRYKGVRRRRWGKWVSEIRVPGTRERLWLGSYATPEGAAVAHDTAVYFLRGGLLADSGASALNFPERAAAAYGTGSVAPLSPRSVQSVASDAGMAADAQLVAARDSAAEAAATGPRQYAELRAGAGAAQGGANAYAYTHMGGGYSGGSSGGREQLVHGDISVDDMEILM